MELAQHLTVYAGRTDVTVLALPRGGVPVAYQVALALGAPLDVYVVRKLGLPGHEELAIGAIASGGVRVLNEDIIQNLDVAENLIDEVAGREFAELQRREQLYRGERPALDVRDRIVILVDDGLATGASMRAAILGLRTQHPARIIVAVPTAAAETCNELELLANQVICASTPRPFDGVGRWYEDFSPTSDEEVEAILELAAWQLQRMR